jgi:hypothetical protein
LRSGKGEGLRGRLNNCYKQSHWSHWLAGFLFISGRNIVSSGRVEGCVGGKSNEIQETALVMSFDSVPSLSGKLTTGVLGLKSKVI